MMQEPDLSKYGAVEISDDELAKYGATPFEEEPTAQSYFQSALQGLKGASGHALNALKQSPQSGLDFIVGANDAITNFPKGIANMVMPESMQVPLSRNGQGLPYDIGNVAGEIGSFIGGGGALNTARLAATKLPSLGKLAESLSGNGLRGIARRGLGSAAYGAIQNPEERGTGAALSGGLSVALDALLGGASKLFPSNSLRGHLPLSQLEENLKVSDEMKTPLGDILGSPTLKRVYENILPKYFGSGIDTATAEVSNAIQNKGQNIVNKYLGNIDPLQVPEKLGEYLKTAFKTQENFKNKTYGKFNKLADEKYQIKPNLEGFSNKSNKFIKVINDQNFLKYEPEEKELLERLINYKDPVKIESEILLPSGEKSYTLKYPTLSEANVLSSRLRNLSKQYEHSPLPEDRKQAKILGALSNTLKLDVKNTIRKSGHKDLKKSFVDAEKNYRENFSSFLDRDVYKFLGGREDPEKLLMNFVKTGSTHDQGNKIKKLTKVLPEEGKNLLKYSYLSRAIEGAENNRQVSANKLKTHWNDSKLGQRQKNALFPDKSERRELDQFSKLVSLNPNALTRMFNPHTGQRVSDLLAPLSTALFGYEAGKEYGGFPGGVAGGIGLPIAAGLATRGGANILHSPQVRKSLIKKMAKKEGKKSDTKYLSDALKAIGINSFSD